MQVFKRVLGEVAVLSLVLSFIGPIPVFAAESPSLGEATAYGVLANIFANGSVTTVNGAVGFTTAPAMSPAGTHVYYGSVTPYATAGADQDTALSAINAETCDFNFAAAVELSTLPQPLAPGVYCSGGAMSITTSITLSGSGTYIFRAVGALNTAASVVVGLTGGANACDIFWAPTGATTLGASTQFKGTVISNAGITVGASSVWTGRALAFNGTVTTDTDTITVPTCTLPDTTAPSAVSNLTLSAATTSTLTLTWTAPGDDGVVGTAASYDIRYSTSPIVTAADFTAASLVSGEPTPAVAGTSQSMIVTGLTTNTTYYFAMKTQDEVPNISIISNVASIATAMHPDIIAPATITTLALSGATTSSIVLTWTAPGDDGASGVASSYDIRYSTSPIISAADFTAATQVSGEPAPAVAGTSQSKTVTGLTANTTYYFVIKTQDEAPNISAISNVPSLATLTTVVPQELTYSADAALVASPTINVDKGLVARPAGTETPCVSETLMKLPSDGNPATQFDSAVYYCGANGQRYVFPDSGTYFSWYTDFSDVTIISATKLASIPLAGNVTYRPGKLMVMIQSDPKVYAVSKGGVLRWVPTETIAQTLYGSNWNRMINNVSDAFFVNYVTGTPITIQ